MRNIIGAKIVISVDVMPESERDYFEYGPHLSGWWILANSLNPFAETVKVPSMADISEMLQWVSSEQHRREVTQASDLHLVPPVQNYGTLEYDKFDEIVEKGYLYAKPLIDEWVAQNYGNTKGKPLRTQAQSRGISRNS
jgi:lysophospholipid hydrolase